MKLVISPPVSDARLEKTRVAAAPMQVVNAATTSTPSPRSPTRTPCSGI